MAFRITEHKAFEYFILIIIVSSSLALCFEDIYLYQKPTLKAVLYYLNILFAVIFTAEMCLKWISLGFKKYFTSFWTVMDFCIVVVSIFLFLFSLKSNNHMYAVKVSDFFYMVPLLVLQDVHDYLQCQNRYNMSGLPRMKLKNKIADMWIDWPLIGIA